MSDSQHSFEYYQQKRMEKDCDFSLSSSEEDFVDVKTGGSEKGEKRMSTAFARKRRESRGSAGSSGRGRSSRSSSGTAGGGFESSDESEKQIVLPNKLFMRAALMNDFYDLERPGGWTRRWNADST